MQSSAIELSGLRFGWNAAETLLAIENLRVVRGERVFLQGPSGSGKSTLLGLLGGVLVAQHGSVRILGTDLGALGATRRDAFRADHIGIIFQQFNLLPFLNARDNITLACRFSPRRRERAGAPIAEAQRLMTALGLDAARFAAQPAHSLSVGQQQRVAAARALIGAPELIIADEPTSALDAQTRDAFLRLLFAECERAGSTLLFVSHDAALAPHFTRALRLADLQHSERVTA
jgi:putative ABC transport system ATP-binding protein